LQLSKISYKSYWLRVVLLAEAVATMPWLFTLTDLTHEPGGQLRDVDGETTGRPPSRGSRQGPLAEFSEMTILLVPDCLDGPCHAAGDAQVGP